MKAKRRKILLSAICFSVVVGLTTMVSAVPINITMSLPLGNGSTLVNDVSAQDIPGSGLGDANVLAWLQSDIHQYNHNLGKNLPDPTTGETSWDNQAPLITVAAGDYLVLHYGKGTQGSAHGGGLVALYFDTAGTYQVPSSGGGPNGKGDISFARLWDHTRVPDGGSTIALLGFALLGVDHLRKRIRSN